MAIQSFPKVWDFAGGGFVHRLIHNKVDRKLVEVEDPRYASESGERPQVNCVTFTVYTAKLDSLWSSIFMFNL